MIKSIRVNGVAPGPIYTPLQISGGATKEHFQNFGADYPLKRAGQPASLRASTYSLRQRTRVTRLEISMVRAEERDSRRALQRVRSESDFVFKENARGRGLWRFHR